MDTPPTNPAPAATPLTNRVSFLVYAPTPYDPQATECVTAYHARQLEQKLAAAQAEVGRKDEALKALRKELSQVEGYLAASHAQLKRNENEARELRDCASAYLFHCEQRGLGANSIRVCAEYRGLSKALKDVLTPSPAPEPKEAHL